VLKRSVVFLYGIVCYVIFFATFLYAIGFVSGFGVSFGAPRTLDSPPSGPRGTNLIIDLALLTLFAVQHSGMARAPFKRVLARIVPVSAERSTYVLASSLALIVMFLYWRPLGGVIWDVQSPVGRTVLYGLAAFGWLTVLATTFLINHFDLFGLRQVWLQMVGRPYQHVGFRSPGPYRVVRHPLYVGFLFAFWAAPHMTVAHLLFAVATTGYILIAIQLEERDLVRYLGVEYVEYRARVPMIVPFTRAPLPRRSNELTR
jgi:methanethiol S-methyltransferase